ARFPKCFRPVASSAPGRRLEPPAERAIQAPWAVEIDVASLQVAAAFIRIVRRTPVQHAAVVEHHELACTQREAQLEPRVGEELAQSPPRPLKAPRGAGIEQGQIVEPRTVVHPGHPADGIALHDRPSFGQLLILVDEPEPHRRRSQQLQALGVLLLQRFRDRQAVHQRGPSAARLIHQTMEELHPRHRLAVRVIGVRSEGNGAISEVIGAGAGVDLENAAEVGLPQIAEATRDPENALRVGGEVTDDDEAMGQERLDGPQAHFVTVQVPPIHADRLQRQIGAPRDLARQTVPEVELISEPAQLILAGIPVAEGQPYPILTSLLDSHERQVIGQSVRVVEALLSLRIQIVRVLASLPQPQRRQLHGAGALAGLDQYPRRIRLEPEAHAAHHTPLPRICSGGTMFARASSSARSASPAQMLSTSSRWDSQISRASTSRLESAMYTLNWFSTRM